MQFDVYINCDGDWDEPEIQISGSSSELCRFGKALTQTHSTLCYSLNQSKDDYYPFSIPNIVLGVEGELIRVDINSVRFQLCGSLQVLKKLGDSIQNFFSRGSTIGQHFHLDYYEGNELLSETNYQMVFLCGRP